MKKNNTLRNFFNYFIGDLFVKGFLFISLPLLSNILSPAEYGKLSLINSAIMILYVFISFNLQNAVINQYMKQKNDFDIYLGSIIIFLLPAQTVFLSLYPFYGSILSALLQISEDDLFWVIIICIQLSYIYIYTSYLQASQQSSKFVRINIISKVSEIILIFLFAMALTNNKYLSKIISQLIINIILLIYLAPLIKKIISFKLNKTYLKYSLFFSVPLIIHVTSNTLLSQADRLIINKFLGEYSAGIYSFSYNIGMAIIVIIMAWNASWQPKLYNLLNEGNLIKIKSNIKNATIIIFIASSSFIFISYEFIYLLSSKDYLSSTKIVPIVIIGNSLIHIYLSYVNFVFYHRKSILISFATLTSLLFNILLNYVLIPIMGIEGAAWATVVAYIILSLLHYLNSRIIMKECIIPLSFLVYYFVGLILSYAIYTYTLQIDYTMGLFIRLSMIILMLFYLYRKKPFLELN